MVNLGNKSMMLLAAIALSGCPCAALATDPEPLPVDSVAIADNVSVFISAGQVC